MGKIFTAGQLKMADKATIQDQNISSFELMNRAAGKAYDWIKPYAKNRLNNLPIKIFCGLGNNGGDGLVIAQKMYQDNILCEVYILKHSEISSEDFKTNLKLVLEKNIPCVWLQEPDILSINKEDLIIDCIFGTGLNKPVTGWLGDCIRAINTSNNIISIDIPSGLYTEENDQNIGEIIKAKHTLTFQFPKLSFFFKENYTYVGTFHVLDIGISKEFIANEKTTYSYNEKYELKNELIPRHPFAYKYNFGHACLIGGSTGKYGAILLSAKACLKSGCGVLTVQVPKNGAHPLLSFLPEAMSMSDENENHISSLFSYEKYHVIGIGPGLGTHEETEKVLKQIIQNSTTPLVIDADALNILSKHKTWISFLPAGSILTPHRKEFERLTGENYQTDYQAMCSAKNMAIKWGVYIVLKGKYTSLYNPQGNVCFNTTGNVSMAKAGSGDVLTGIITSLVAQGYDSWNAIKLGVYLHGISGDFATTRTEEACLLASDIIENIPHAYKFLKEANI